MQRLEIVASVQDNRNAFVDSPSLVEQLYGLSFDQFPAPEAQPMPEPEPKPMAEPILQPEPIPVVYPQPRPMSEQPFVDRNCSDFKTQLEAQAFFLSEGPGDTHWPDGDGNGIACESLSFRNFAASLAE